RVRQGREGEDGRDRGRGRRQGDQGELRRSRFARAYPMTDQPADLLSLLAGRFRAHPWHGVSIGDKAPHVVTAYIEIVPTDTVKYELDKTTGILKVDRPQRFSNVCPSLYGLVPQTYCAEEVGELCAKRTGRAAIRGDGDPLDICVLTEKG